MAVAATRQPWFQVLLVGATLTSLVCAVDAEGNITDAGPTNTTTTLSSRDALPSGLRDDHVGIVFGVAAATIAAVAAAGVMSAFGRLLHLPVIMVAVVWLVVWLVAVLTWWVTYIEARDVIHQKTNDVLQQAGLISDRITAEIAGGVAIAEHIAALSGEGAIDITRDVYPRTVDVLIRLTKAFGSSMLYSVYYGTHTGRLVYYQPQAAGGGTVIHSAQRGRDVFPPSLRCVPFDTADDPEVCATAVRAGCRGVKVEDVATNTTATATEGAGSDAAANATTDGAPGRDLRPFLVCQGSCEAPPSQENCFVNPSSSGPNQIMWVTSPGGPGAPAMTAGGNSGTMGVQTASLQPSAREVNITAESWAFDPRNRVWYTRREGLQWTDAYVFVDGVLRERTPPVGMTASMALYDGVGAGQQRGVVAVDFTLRSAASLLRGTRPTRNAVAILANARGQLLASSLDEDALLAATGSEDSLARVVDLRSPNVTDVLRRPIELLAERYGGLEHAVEHQTTLVKEPVVIVAHPIHLGGDMTILYVVSLPYADVMGAADNASLRALALTTFLTVACTLIVFGLLHLALRPLRRLAEDMDRVALMQFDDVQPARRSLVYEVDWMGRSFEKMVGNLMVYRQYLPSTMLEAAMDQPAASTIFSAFVFTDIAGGDEQRNLAPHVRREIMQHHKAIVRRAVTEHFGVEVRCVENAYTIRFDTMDLALRFALALHENVSAHPWPPQLSSPAGDASGVRLRTGVCAGSVSVETHADGRKEYSGMVLNTAARLEAICIPGAVCCVAKQLCSVDMSGVAKPLLFRSKAFKSKTLDIKEVVMMVPARAAATHGACVEAALRQRELDVRRAGKQATTAGGPRRAGAYQSCDLRRRQVQHGLRRVAHATVMCIQLRLCPSRRYRVQPEACVTAHDNDGAGAKLGPQAGLVEKVLVDCLTRLQRSQGNVCTVIGTAIFASWNVMRQCSAHEAQSLRFLPLIHGMHNDTVKVSCGVVRGPAILGSVGGSGQRFFTVIGRSVPLCRLLADTALRVNALALLTCMSGHPAAETVLLEGEGVWADGAAGLLRPVDVWTLKDDATPKAEEMSGSGRSRPLFIYEFAIVDGASAGTSMMDLHGDAVCTAPPGWRAAYADAFFRDDSKYIASLGGADPVLGHVAEAMKTGCRLDRGDTSIVVPTTEIF